ncbi:hypothetical protein NOR_02324 [Metarhizium rileyi]|uniref:Uncharacterized protein n=1 Tax=Metarhizium rileyi (strain RCEF 4871) TaxID=1649241 RepID=A0A167HEV5_METRR|nr:hypothetical protein NOR_02324 [Metarhizium rileyi RCEF 4871]
MDFDRSASPVVMPNDLLERRRFRSPSTNTVANAPTRPAGPSKPKTTDQFFIPVLSA